MLKRPAPVPPKKPPARAVAAANRAIKDAKANPPKISTTRVD